MSGASVIIPTLNEEKYLPGLLASLSEVGSPLEIIVVDGESEDSTARVVEEFSKLLTGPISLRLLRSKRGISRQRNAGAAVASHPVLMFCDADVVFASPEDFHTLTSAFLEGQYHVAAPIFTPLESELHVRLNYAVTRFIQRISVICGRPYFGGYCLLTTKQMFEQLGGFDEEIRLAEDVDYSLRASRVGRYGIIPVRVPVSARRYIKYGYKWLLKEWRHAVRLALTGRVSQNADIFYPFGEYSDIAKK